MTLLAKWSGVGSEKIWFEHRHRRILAFHTQNTISCQKFSFFACLHALLDRLTKFQILNPRLTPNLLYINALRPPFSKQIRYPPLSRNIQRSTLPILTSHFQNTETGFCNQFCECARESEQRSLCFVEFSTGETGGGGAVVAGVGLVLFCPFGDYGLDVCCEEGA